MSQWRQPWERCRLGQRRVLIQVLDPQTAFELEPELVARFGDHLTMACAAPAQVFGGMWAHAAGVAAPGKGVAESLRDPTIAPGVAATALTTLTRMLARAVSELDVDPEWLTDITGRLLLERLEVDGERWDEWSDLRLRPFERWRLLAAQLRQTYGPLWTRSPYTLRSKVKNYGVPQPKDVPLAVRWAEALAKQGSASSAFEILERWTPVQVIQIVETTAWDAERQRRAQDAARATP